MNKWFTSDTHFSHANIIRYTGRPFQSVNEMDERLIENWNALITLNKSEYRRSLKPCSDRFSKILLDSGELRKKCGK